MKAAESMPDRLFAFAQAQARFATGLPGGAEWSSLRTDALARFSRLGLPTPRDESWKYSPLRLLEKRLLEVPGTDTVALAIDAVESSRLALHDARMLVFVNGRLMPALSDTVDSGVGLRCQPLAESLAQRPRELRDRIAVAGDSADERLALLNLAFLGDGATISASADTRAGILYLLFLSSGSGRVFHPRLVLDAAPGARLTIVEHYAGAGDEETLANCVTDIRLDEGAELEHLLLVEGGARSVVLNSICAQIAAGARLSQCRVLIRALHSRASLHAALAGRNSTIEANSLALADRREHLEVHSLIEHRAAHTRSAERFRGIASDRGRGVFNGRIVVQPGAAKSDSQQSSRALLLSEQAEMYARPQLEILTDDVKCSHGATTGRLDPSMLFYLLSRGIDAETARALLIRAFLADALVTLQPLPLRQQIERRIGQALPRAQQIGDLA
jgi:Fe-S cluster assembly protein SufD